MLASWLHTEAAQQWPDKRSLHVEALEAQNQSEFNSSQPKGPELTLAGQLRRPVLRQDGVAAAAVAVTACCLHSVPSAVRLAAAAAAAAAAVTMSSRSPFCCSTGAYPANEVVQPRLPLPVVGTPMEESNASRENQLAPAQ